MVIGWSSGRRATVLVPGATVLVVIGSFLPWVATGARTRNSFDIIDAGLHIGLLDGLGVLAVVWYLVPLTAAMSGLAVWFGRIRLAGGLATVVGVEGAAMAVAVELSPLATRLGVAVTLAGGVLAGAAGIAALVRGRPESVRSPAAKRAAKMASR